jgi:hypothetical protein
MSRQQDLKRVRKGQATAAEAREKSEKLHAEAVTLVRVFPHLGKVSHAMWAISVFGVDAVTKACETNLSAYHLKQALRKLSVK